MATRRALLAAGVPPDVVDNDVKVGRYYPVHRGVYAIGPLSPRGQMVAALLAGGPEAALCFAGALVPFGLMAPRPTIDVATPRHRRDSEDVRFHRLSLDARDLTHRDGLRVTTIERTLLDLAATGAPIGLLAHEALARKLTTQRKLADTANRHRGRKGAPALLASANARHTRSGLERRFLRFLAEHDLPLPLTNHRLGPYTVDCLYPDHKLVIETDEDGHRSAHAFEDDRRRDRHLAAKGYRTMRVTEAALHPRLAQELSEALASPPP